jgi:hypothetical protein
VFSTNSHIVVDKKLHRFLLVLYSQAWHSPWDVVVPLNTSAGSNSTLKNVQSMMPRGNARWKSWIWSGKREQEDKVLYQVLCSPSTEPFLESTRWASSTLSNYKRERDLGLGGEAEVWKGTTDGRWKKGGLLEWGTFLARPVWPASSDHSKLPRLQVSIVHSTARQEEPQAQVHLVINGFPTEQSSL